VRSGGARGESFPIEGRSTGALVGDRVAAALEAVGVMAPDEVSMTQWSATPAERLTADSFVVPGSPR
jgi:hypothetical protein